MTDKMIGLMHRKINAGRPYSGLPTVCVKRVKERLGGARRFIFQIIYSKGQSCYDLVFAENLRRVED